MTSGDVTGQWVGGKRGLADPYTRKIIDGSHDITHTISCTKNKNIEHTVITTNNICHEGLECSPYGVIQL